MDNVSKAENVFQLSYKLYFTKVTRESIRKKHEVGASALAAACWHPCPPWACPVSFSFML